MDLAEALWGENPISIRRLASLINGLPLDSALVRSYDPKRLGRGWGTQEELLAIIAELLDVNNRYFLSAHVKPGTQLPKPIYIPRPDDTQRKPPTPKQVLGHLAAKGIPVVRSKKKRKV